MFLAAAKTKTLEAWRRGAESLRQELGLDEAEVLLEGGRTRGPTVVVLIAHGNVSMCLKFVNMFYFSAHIDRLLREQMRPGAEEVKALAKENAHATDVP